MNIIKKIRDVYNMLEDDISKEIYMAKISFYIGDRDYSYWYPIVNKYAKNLVKENEDYIKKIQMMLSKDKNIVLYGAGDDAKANLIYWKDDKRLIGFCDSDKKKQQEEFCGYKVFSPEQLLTMDDINIVISTHSGYDSIRERLLAAGVDENRIHLMSPYMFNMDTEQYFDVDFMKFSNDEILVDAGCFDFKTVLTFEKYCKNIRKVYSFEPDKNNYKICKQNKERFLPKLDAEILPYGTWSSKTVLHFSSSCSAASSISDEGNDFVEVVSIDEIVGNNPVTFIKMDVEGAELESLIGAKNVIQRCKPKLAICIYHKEEDLFTIPQYIKELVPDYKFFIRHHSNGAGETVLYAIP
jgi:FkbM family methyltransferase